MKIKSYPLLMIILCASFLFYKYILQVYPSVITDSLRENFKLSGTGLGNLAATFYYAYMIMQLFAGPLIDKWGVRKNGSIAFGLSAIGLIIFAGSTHILGANLSRALMGIGVSFSTIVYMKTAAVWFSPKRYSIMGGLLVTAAMGGAVFGTAPLAFFMSLWGWREVLAAIGVIGLVLTLLFWLLVKDHPPTDAQHEKTAEPHLPVTRHMIYEVLKDKRNWMLTLYTGFAFSPLAVLAGLWGNPFLQTAYHLNVSDAGSLISLSFIGLGIGSPLLGMLSNWYSRFSILYISGILSLISVLIVLYIPHLSFAVLGILLFSFGFFLGSFMLVFTIGKEINSLAVTATVVAMINASDAFLDAFTEPAIGKFLDWHATGSTKNGLEVFNTADYHVALAILPLYLCLSLVCLMLFQWFQSQKDRNHTAMA